MAMSNRHELHCAPYPLRCAQAVALPLALTGCEAMGELARTVSWAWIGGVIAVLVVVGCLTSRMRR